MKKLQRRSECPVSSSLDIFGDKWSLLIIRDLMFGDKKTYGDFLGSEERIATNILADRLAWLEQEDIINSETDLSKRSRKLYRLTEKGADLAPVIMELVLWGVKHFETTNAPASFVERIRNSPEEIVREVKDASKN